MRTLISFILKPVLAITSAVLFIALTFIICSFLGANHSFEHSDIYLPLITAFALLLLFFVISSLFKFIKNRSLKSATAIRPTVFKIHFAIYITIFFIAFIVMSQPRISHQYYNITGAEHIPDSLLVYKYPPNAERHEIILNDKDTIVNATYHFDSLGRRKMPVHQDAKKATLFFGCSYTFGDGVSDDQTLPYQYYLRDTSENVYNYAIDGWGPQQTLLLLRSRDVTKEVAKLGTVTGIYVFIDDQIRRVICDKHHINTWTKDFACFTIENDSLIYKGTFGNVYPSRCFIYKLISDSKVFDGINIPSHLSKTDYKTTAEIIRQSSLSFGKQFSHSKFYVVIYPGQDNTIASYLRKANLNVIDLSTLFSNPIDMLIPNHGHPIPRAYEVVSKEIFKNTN